LYIQKGYLTSGAYLPPQSFKNGVVEIRVLEGSLTEIQVTGTRRLQPNYIRSRLALATTPPLNRDRLLEALQLLRLNPLIDNLSAELATGTQPGQSILTVKIAEAKTFGAQITLDNNRSPSVGTDRRQIQLSQANLLGLGDRVSLSYTNTNGSNTADFSYTLPVSPRDTTLSFNGGFSTSNVIEAPFNILDITSQSHYVELTLRHPWLRTPTREFAVGLTATHRYSQSRLLDDVPFPSAGADGNGRTRLTALRFFQEYTQRSSRSVFALRSQFSVGLNAFNATINDTAPDSRFWAWRGQVQWVRALAPDTLLLLRGDMQLADRALLPFEQFGLGGQDSIRGYRQDALLADRGLFAAAELRLPILRLPRANTLLQIAPFFEIGTVSNAAGGTGLDPNTLASVGLGLRLQVGDRLTARFDWGIPLIDLPGEKRTWQEKGLYFSLIYTPF
jgi:hemolysin activation/secretion protein